MLIQYIKVFIVGGLFCVVAQLLIDKTKLTPARILVGYVCAGVILGAFGLYDPIIKFAGSGATVPLTGFGNLLANGVRKQIETDGLIGALTGGLKATAGGVSAAIFFGFIFAAICKSKKPSN